VRRRLSLPAAAAEPRVPGGSALARGGASVPRAWRLLPRPADRGGGKAVRGSPGFYLAYLVLVVIAGAGLAAATGSLAFLPVLARGLLVTIEITLLSACLGLAVAFPAGLAKLHAAKPLRWLAIAYIELFRGTSALVQLFWLYFVLPHFGIELPAMMAAVLALGLNIGAYGAEIVRGTIAAVPRDQWEAAAALSLGRRQTLWLVVLPQALKAMVPPWGNLAIELLKATSLVSLVTLADLAFRAQQLNLATYRTPDIYGLLLLLYLALSLLLTLGMRLLARRFEARWGQAR
jgi:polar amino acid transport system permease protein